MPTVCCQSQSECLCSAGPGRPALDPDCGSTSVCAGSELAALPPLAAE